MGTIPLEVEPVFQADAVARLHLRPALYLLHWTLMGIGIKHRGVERTHSLMQGDLKRTQKGNQPFQVGIRVTECGMGLRSSS